MTQTYGKGKRFITLLLAVVMLFSLALPAAAVSETESTAEPTAEAAATPETSAQPSAKPAASASPEMTAKPSEAPAVSASPETESETENGETQPLYAPARAEKDGYFVLAAETSADGVTTDGFALAPVRVEYKTGDTILDAVARLEDVTVSERFGADVETGRITLNDEEYIATCDTHVGVMTLTDMYRPEEVHVVRLHQSVQSENGKDYFPETLQKLLRAMAAAEDKGSEAYLAALESYGEAVESPALAAKLTAALGWTPESEASPTPAASQTPAPCPRTAGRAQSGGPQGNPGPAPPPPAPPPHPKPPTPGRRSGGRRRCVGHQGNACPGSHTLGTGDDSAGTGAARRAHGKLGRRREIALRVAVRIPGGFPVCVSLCGAVGRAGGLPHGGAVRDAEAPFAGACLRRGG